MTQDNRGNNNKNAGNNFIDNSQINLLIQEENIKRLPSLLAEIFPNIADSILDYGSGYIDEKFLITYEIEEKITHNNVNKYRFILEDYGSFLIPVENYLASLDFNTPGRKRTFLLNIRRMYLDILYELNNKKIEKDLFIKEIGGDIIIDGILSKIFQSYIESSNVSKKHTKEEIEFAIIVILCKAFIECNILENPNG